MRPFPPCRWLRDVVRAIFSFALFVAAAVQTTSTFAAEPTLSGVSPVGFQRGNEVVVQFSGTRLNDIEEILFFSPGFTVAGFEEVKEEGFKAKITAAPDLEPGIYALRLRTKSGLSNMKTITVGHLPDTQDVEPNDSIEKAQPLPLNHTVIGSIPREDSDFFAVDLKQGDRLNAEVEGLRLGNSYFDPYLAIFNADQVEQIRNDDATLLFSDSLCSFVAPADGKYFVMIRESAIGGQGGGYRLHVGTFPRPTAIFPPGGKPGETLQVRWIGDAKGDFTSAVTLPTDGREDVPLFAEDAGGRAPSGNIIRVNALESANEIEPNDTPEQPTPAVVPGAMNGIIEQPGDTDFFKVNAKKGEQFDVRVLARMPFRSPLDSVLTISKAKGGNVGSNDDSNNLPDSYLRFSVPEDGDYLISVRDQLARGGANFVYRIEVTEVKPKLVLSLPERQQYVSNTIDLPKNNRMAFMLALSRNNFGGEVAISLPQLPPGVTAEVINVPGDRGTVPVLLTASSEATTSGALAPILGKTTDPNLPVEGSLKQRTMLIRGNNNRDVWGYDSDKLALAVTEELPFSIEIVPPQAPLPRNGSAELKIVAKRAADFKAPIAVALVYAPDGTSASGSISIPEGATEAIIPITANASAPFQVWKLVAFGKSSAGRGNIECSSQFVDFSVVENFYGITLPKTAIEIGHEATLTAGLEVKHPFEGDATAEIKGLPTGVTAEPVKFNKDATQLVFTLKAAADARVGKHTTLVCQITQQVSGEKIVHNLANGELRIDPQSTPKPMSNAPAAPAGPKPASRLEQLRQQK